MPFLKRSSKRFADSPFFFFFFFWWNQLGNKVFEFFFFSFARSFYFLLQLLGMAGSNAAKSKWYNEHRYGQDVLYDACEKVCVFFFLLYFLASPHTFFSISCCWIAVLPIRFWINSSIIRSTRNPFSRRFRSAMLWITTTSSPTQWIWIQCKRRYFFLDPSCSSLKLSWVVADAAAVHLFRVVDEKHAVQQQDRFLRRSSADLR